MSEDAASPASAWKVFLLALLQLAAIVVACASLVVAMEWLRTRIFDAGSAPRCGTPAAGVDCVSEQRGTLLDSDDPSILPPYGPVSGAPTAVRCDGRVHDLDLYDLARPPWQAFTDRSRLPAPPAPVTCLVRGGTVLEVRFPATGAVSTTSGVPWEWVYTLTASLLSLAVGGAILFRVLPLLGLVLLQVLGGIAWAVAWVIGRARRRPAGRDGP